MAKLKIITLICNESKVIESHDFDLPANVGQKYRSVLLAGRIKEIVWQQIDEAYFVKSITVK